jgi:hypothetical protein
MKKFLLIAVVLVVAAAAAVAAVFIVSDVVAQFTYTPGTLSIPQKTAFVVAHGDGVWFEATGVETSPTAVFHDAGTPIPADYDVAVATGWAGTSLEQLEHGTQIRIRIPEAGVDLSYDRGTGGTVDSAAYWTGPMFYDQSWIDFLSPVTDFEPRTGSQVYANHWWLGLSDTQWEKGLATHLAPDGRLPQGTYTVHFEETAPEPAAGLTCIYDGPLTPYHPGRGTNVTAPFTFTVGSPSP